MIDMVNYANEIIDPRLIARSCHSIKVVPGRQVVATFIGIHKETRSSLNRERMAPQPEGVPGTRERLAQTLILDGRPARANAVRTGLHVRLAGACLAGLCGRDLCRPNYLAIRSR